MFGKKDKQQNENRPKKTKECSLPVLIFLILVGLLFTLFSDYFFCPIHTFLTMFIEFVFFFVVLPVALIYTGITRKRFLEDESKSKKTAAVLGTLTLGTLLLFLKTGTVLLGEKWELPPMFEDVTIKWSYPTMKEDVRIAVPEDETEKDNDDYVPKAGPNWEIDSCLNVIRKATECAFNFGTDKSYYNAPQICQEERAMLGFVSEVLYRKAPDAKDYCDFYYIAYKDPESFWYCRGITGVIPGEAACGYLRDPSVRIRIHRKTGEISQVQSLDWSEKPCTYSHNHEELEGYWDAMRVEEGYVYMADDPLPAWQYGQGPNNEDLNKKVMSCD